MGESKEQESVAQFVGFRLGQREYAVDIRKIIEIIYFRTVTPMPEAPDFVDGVVDLRGKVIPVVDLKKIMKVSSPEDSNPNHILIVRFRKGMLGVIVDNVQEVLSFSLEKIQSPQSLLGDQVSPLLKGVYRDEKRLFFILSMDKLFPSLETIQSGGKP